MLNAQELLDAAWGKREIRSAQRAEELRSAASCEASCRDAIEPCRGIPRDPIGIRRVILWRTGAARDGSIAPPAERNLPRRCIRPLPWHFSPPLCDEILVREAQERAMLWYLVMRLQFARVGTERLQRRSIAVR